MQSQSFGTGSPDYAHHHRQDKGRGPPEDRPGLAGQKGRRTGGVQVAALRRLCPAGLLIANRGKLGLLQSRSTPAAYSSPAVHAHRPHPTSLLSLYPRPAFSRLCCLAPFPPFTCPLSLLHVPLASIPRRGWALGQRTRPAAVFAAAPPLSPPSLPPNCRAVPGSPGGGRGAGGGGSAGGGCQRWRPRRTWHCATAKSAAQSRSMCTQSAAIDTIATSKTNCVMQPNLFLSNH